MSALQLILDRIVQHCDPDKVILFGSHAYGTTHEDSDLDLCVVKSGLKQRIKLQAELCMAILDITPMVDIIAIDSATMDKPAFRSSVLFDIQNKGRLLYDKVQA